MQTPNTTHMVAPPADQTQMVAPEKKVMLKFLLPTEVNGTVYQVGAVEMFPVEQAKELLKFKVTGGYAFSGERSEKDAARVEYRRVEVVREAVADELV